jgi:hypothetical protein
MGEIVWVNGEAIDGADIDAFFGPLRLWGLMEITAKIAKDKKGGTGPGNRESGRSYGKKRGTGTVRVKLANFMEINAPLQALGFDVTDLAPFPMIVVFKDKNRTLIPDLGMDVVEPKPNIGRVQILEHVDITDFDYGGSTDDQDLGVPMPFIFYAG